MTSNTQSKYSKMGKRHKEYWIRRGFDILTAETLSKEYASKCSVWSKKYWIRKGYTDKDADRKILEYNPSSILFRGYKDDINKFYERCSKTSEQIKKRLG